MNIIEIKIGNNLISSSQTISMLGLEYDKNFSTAPYLKKLAREANICAALIRRLSFGMPNCVLKPIANGILMGKILNAAPAAFPIKLSSSDKPFLSGVMNEIDKSIKSAARTISRVKLTDKVRSEIVLKKSGLRSLTEAVSQTMASVIWKGRKSMNPLGCIFPVKSTIRSTRSSGESKLCQPVPGYPQLASNKLAQLWNLSNLDTAKTLGSAKSLVTEWIRKNANDLK